MTAEELDAIEARANAATPGPWETGLEKVYSPKSGVPHSNPVVTVGDIYALPDREFMAAARADVPALVAEVRRLRTEIATLRCTNGCAGARGTACPDGACNRCCYTEHVGHDII